MKYVLLLLFVIPALPNWSKAQSTVTGLGNYIVGITTPDSLNRADFTEEDQSYVKGTIALTCTHIRTFTSPTVTIGGISVTNVVLVFYDNYLFKISCDYRDSLKATFLEKYGPGVRRPMSRFQFCTKGKDTPLLMQGESWSSGNFLAFVVHWRGYTADCKQEDGARLTITSQPMLALSSDCDLKPTDELVEEFLKAQTDNPGKQR